MKRPSKDTGHLSREVLEAYVLGHVSEDAATGIRNHLLMCPPCCACVSALTEEINGISLVLTNSAGVESGACPDEFLLAQFLDRSLPEPERARLISHLASCTRCRTSLVAMRKETTEIRECAASPDNAASAGVAEDPDRLPISEMRSVAQSIADKTDKIDRDEEGKRKISDSRQG